MLDSFHLWGVLFIQELQLNFKNVSGVMLFLSHIGDPKIAFNIYFPVAYYLHNSVGKRVLWAAVISEWLNSVLKWLLHGERPYWWVHTSGFYKQEHVPHLQQFSITCETGPGSPSGHAMVTSAVWYVLVSDFLYYQQIQSFGLKILCWATYVIMMCAVCLSRLFIATHFPHQVSAGIIIGILLGMVMNSLATSALQLPFYLLTSFLLAFIATMTYLLLNLVGIDPFWSLASATKWCAFQEWVHLDTTLFYCIVRDISCLLGLGLAVFCCQFKKLTCRSQKTIILQVLVAVLMLHAGDRLKLNIHNIVLFYVEAFFKHLFLTFVVAAGIPVVFSLF
nr:glucose-6-phosphatase 3-like isoform X1 [Biomphalaria glabrata]